MRGDAPPPPPNPPAFSLGRAFTRRCALDWSRVVKPSPAQPLTRGTRRGEGGCRHSCHRPVRIRQSKLCRFDVVSTLMRSIKCLGTLLRPPFPRQRLLWRDLNLEPSDQFSKQSHVTSFSAHTVSSSSYTSPVLAACACSSGLWAERGGGGDPRGREDSTHGLPTAAGYPPAEKGFWHSICRREVPSTQVWVLHKLRYILF